MIWKYKYKQRYFKILKYLRFDLIDYKSILVSSKIIKRHPLTCLRANERIIPKLNALKLWQLSTNDVHENIYDINKCNLNVYQDQNIKMVGITAVLQ